MNAIDMLDQQHEAVERLFEELEEARGDARTALFDELADSLAMHTTIEERHFYPSVRDVETEVRLHESLVEHLSIKRILADLLTLDSDDERFDARLNSLREEVEHHVREERELLFPAVRRALGEDQLEGLGQEMLATMAELMSRHPSEDIQPVGQP